MDEKNRTYRLARGLPLVLIAVLLTGSAFGAALRLPVGAAPDIIYVKGDATGADNGSSWEDAYTDLQTALTAAQSGHEIWVAGTTYKPAMGSDRSATFRLKGGVALYGGFAGGETGRDQRDWQANVTILSGDIGVAGDGSDNSYHVVTGSGTDGTAWLDGFTITDGRADGDPALGRSRGGGMYTNNGAPTLVNCTFSGNSALDGGGGMYNTDSSPTLTNCSFISNSARYGGGMANEGSSPVLANCTFTGNAVGGDGGGMYNDGSRPTLVNGTFVSNSAEYGGGVFNVASDVRLTGCTLRGNSAANSGGGMLNAISALSVTNCTLSGNSAHWGGGVYNYWYSDLTLANCTFSNNSADLGGGMYNDSSHPTLRNTIVAHSTAGGDCAGDPPTSEGHNLDSDGTCGLTAGGDLPSSDALLGPLQDNGGPTFTHALLAGSPALDGGDPEGCIDAWGAPLTTDQRGVPRPMDGDCNGISICDIGAVEAPAACYFPNTFCLPIVLESTP